jgi:general secretion pathway protein B
MSFILDALKKSEADRQRQSGPALFEVKVAPPRRRLPLWAVAIAVLLLVNLGIVLWLLLRHPSQAASETAALPPAPPVAQSAPPLAQSAPPAIAPLTAAATPPPATAPAPAPAAGNTAPASAPPAAPPAAATAQTAPPSSANTPPAPQPVANRSEPAGSEGGNPADYAPAEEPPADAPSGHVRRGTVAGVPLYQDAAAVPGMQIPQLRLDLHVYAPHPQDRFVMINMHKVHEGDTLPEGVHVDSITPEGALLSYNGSRFLLPRD